MEVLARAPLTVDLGSARGARIFCALAAHRAVRLLAHRSIIPEDARLSAAPHGQEPGDALLSAALQGRQPGDALQSAALAALRPPAGHALTPPTGPEGPGTAEADALAALAALNPAAARIRSPAELAQVAARLGRRLGKQLDEDRLLAAALGGLVLVRPGPDGPEAERLRPPRSARLLWRPDGSTAWMRTQAPGILSGPGEGLRVTVRHKPGA